jgi:hypothetical protein
MSAFERFSPISNHSNIGLNFDIGYQIDYSNINLADQINLISDIQNNRQVLYLPQDYPECQH